MTGLIPINGFQADVQHKAPKIEKVEQGGLSNLVDLLRFLGLHGREKGKDLKGENQVVLDGLEKYHPHAVSFFCDGNAPKQ